MGARSSTTGCSHQSETAAVTFSKRMSFLRGWESSALDLSSSIIATTAVPATAAAPNEPEIVKSPNLAEKLVGRP